MDVLILIFSLCVLGVIIYAILDNSDSLKERNEKLRIEKEQKERIEKEREEARLKAKKEWHSLLDERTQKYGTLTAEIGFGSNKENHIYVYEQSKTIFILGKKYDFKDIFSCNIEKYLHKKGTTTHTTTPDKGEMAIEQFLWGMGQKYNVKSTTETKTTSDIYFYKVYIGINSISEPQIGFKVVSSDTANRIKNLINIIINQNNQQ